MEDKATTRLSRFLSLILRHKPETIGITLDAHGWADVKELMDGVNRSGRKIDRELLEHIVAADEKGRYVFSEDGNRIRACQGHSLDVDMQFTAARPPEFLYHGTAERFTAQIERDGLTPKTRQYVHLSLDRETAVNVGSRHGKPVVYTIHAREMHQAGLTLYCSENNVWLTDNVPPKYLSKNND